MAATRRLVVHDVAYRWRFAPGRDDSTLVVRGPLASGRALVVTLVGWRDPWLALDGFVARDGELALSSAARNDPPLITPRFARAAIEAARARGWDPDARGPAFGLTWRDGAFGAPPAS